MSKTVLIGIAVISIIAAGSSFFWSQNGSSPTKAPVPTQSILLKTPPPQKILPTDYHIFQSFNNCGPAALSMALRFYGVQKSQEELGQDLRPYQNPQGDNDDKSVTLEELAQKAKELGFVSYHRPNGDIKLIKYFITYDMPVIARTWTKPDEDIGHYRVIKGYDEITRRLIQDDSLQDKNLWYSYEDFNILWEKFNYEYLVLVPQDKVEIVKTILGEEQDEKIAWKNAVNTTQKKLLENPNDVNTRFNLSIALYNAGDFERSIKEFEKVENQLPPRTLWYQIEPILAYQKMKNYDKVFALTDRILGNANRAFSELYFIRGEIYKEQGKKEEARHEFDQALFYKPNYEVARQKLDTL